MIKFEKTEVLGWEHALRGMRNPKRSWHLSDSQKLFDKDFGDYIDYLGGYDRKLCSELAKGGSTHAKYRHMVVVYTDITAPLYWWKEFDTYKVGTVANSTSTLYDFSYKEFSLEDFSNEYITDEPIYNAGLSGNMVLYNAVLILNRCREAFLTTGDKLYWNQMVQLLPTSYNQLRTVMMNYEVLAGIYKTRKGHRLDEWREFCKWIERLPYSELITEGGE